MSLLHPVLRSAAWVAGAQWGSVILQFGVSIVLAQVLNPRDYGVVSLSVIFTGFTSLFTNLGFGAALIERRQVEDDCIDTAFWSTAILGGLLCCVTALAAPLASEFYGESQLVSVIRVAALGLVFAPVNDILNSLLTRRMEFRTIASIEFASSCLSQATALALAFAGFGVWSIVLANLTMQSVRFVALLHAAWWTPRLRFSRQFFQELLSFGGHLFGFQFVNYFVRNLDNVIIGKFLGTTALGYYDLAYQLTLKPISLVSSTFTQPLFPALAALKSEKKQAADLYRSVVVYISLLTFPILLGLALVAPEAIACVLGEKWLPATTVLRILCIAGAMNCIATTVGAVFLSQGRSDLMLKWVLAAAPFSTAAFLLGVQWGVEGVAFGYALFTATAWVIAHAIANRLIGLPAKHFWSALLPSVKASLIMVVTVMLARFVMSDLRFAPLPMLIVAVVLGAGSYWAATAWETAEEVTKARGYLLTKFSVSFTS